MYVRNTSLNIKYGTIDIYAVNFEGRVSGDIY